MLPAGFLTPFCEHFQPELLGGKRERLPHSQGERGWPLCRKVTDGFSAFFAILDTDRRNHRLSGKPELHLPTQSPGRETALSPPIGARVTLWSEQLEHCLGIRKALEPLNLKSFVCAQVSLGADTFSLERRVRLVAEPVELQFLRQLPLRGFPLPATPPPHRGASLSSEVTNIA